MVNTPPGNSDKDSERLPDDAAGAIGGWMIALLWLVVLIGGSLLAKQWLDARSEASKPYWDIAADGSPELILKADRYGQYALAGSTNGERIEFLVDTGASQISIPAGVADQLNLRRGRSYPVQTANGEVTVFATVLDEVSIGPFTMNNVPAHVNPGMNGDVALLGMSFLRHFELKQRAGELTISAP